MILKILAALLLAVPAALSAQSVTAEQLRRHIDILASDAFEGRAPGTAGEKKTTDYIVAQWQALGLQPAGEGGWYQPVALVSRTPRTQSAAFRGKRSNVEFDQAGIVLVGRSAQEDIVDAPLVFGGYGMASPKGGHNGAAVLLLHDGPAGILPFEERANLAAANGASAVLAVYGKDAPWRWVQRSYERGLDELELEPRAAIEGAVSAAAAARLAGAAGLDFERLAAAAAAPGFKPVRLRGRVTLGVATELARTLSNNVVGRLPGRGDGRQAVLFLGHWDHIGICREETEADRICNGAVDNASGIAALIEIARNLSRGPRPSRDILFLATTAEEIGLLGAEHFAARPPVPLASIVAALNLDTIAIGPKGEKVAVIGRGRPRLDALVDATIAAAGRTLDTDGEADAFVTRQDGWALARAGVPSLMVGGSFSDMAKLEAFLTGPYHKASDNPGPHLMLDGAAEDAELLVALGRALADPALYPSQPSPPPLARP